MLSTNIETFLCCDKPFDKAETILFGAPFDSTTSYRPGTRFGSSAIRRESYGVESYSHIRTAIWRMRPCWTAVIWSCASAIRLMR